MCKKMSLTGNHCGRDSLAASHGSVLNLLFRIVSGLTWWTGPVLALISFFVLGIDEGGAEIEEPFGHAPNGLPLDLICDTMLKNIENLITTAPSTRYYCDLPDNMVSTPARRA